MNINRIAYNRDDKLAKKLGVSRQTVERCKKKFAAANILKYNVGVIFLNPQVFFRGKAKGRTQATYEYMDFEGLGDPKGGGD